MSVSEKDYVGLTYRALSQAERDMLQEIKERGQAFIAFLDGLGESHATEIARVRAEEAVMWAVKHVTGRRE